ncbi:MAG: hypothetical protein OQK57_08545 [Ignavibacteriaceae bacterium]|nr:hypothetical protein [Ignavibacteriaceae bacterium]
MKKYIFCTVYLSISGLLFYGCSRSQTVQTTTIYLQELEVTGPINQSPIHLTDSSDTPSITFSPKFSYSTQTLVTGKISGHSPVNENGIFQVDTIFNIDGSVNHYEKTPGVNNYDYKENNLMWNIPAVAMGLDVDIKITRSFALFGGINYSSNNNQSLWGGNFGLGLFGVSAKGLAFRLDVGAKIQSIYFDAHTVEDVRITGSSGSQEYVIFYHDANENSHLNPFINFTINSCNNDWVFNFFLNFGYSTQTLADFEPQHPDDNYYDDYFYPYDSYREIVYDLRGESTFGFLQFTPGITFDLAENSRLLLGAGFYFITDFDNASAKTFILPMMQVDFTL